MAKLRSSERSDRSHPFSHNLLHIRHLIKQSDQNHENTASMIKSSSNTNKWIFVQLASWQTQYHLWLASTSAGWSESSSRAAWPLARTSRRSSWCSPAEGGIWMYELLATQYFEDIFQSKYIVLILLLLLPRNQSWRNLFQTCWAGCCGQDNRGWAQRELRRFPVSCPAEERWCKVHMYHQSGPGEWRSERKC